MTSTASRKKKPAAPLLSGKRRPTRHYEYALGDVETAAEALRRAALTVTRAVLLHGEESAEVLEAAKAQEQAQAALDACKVRITFHNAKPARFLELIAAHPPTEDGKRRGEQWNPETFPPALIAECAVDDRTAGQWAAELDSGAWSLGERHELFETALAVNVGEPARARPF